MKKSDIIHNNRTAVHYMYQCLKDFIVAHDEQNEEQMLSVYYASVKVIEFYKRTQLDISDALLAEQESE